MPGKPDVTEGEIENEILNSEKTITSQKTDISTRNIKENIEILAVFLCTSVNSAIKPPSFSSSMKLADAKPLHKKGRKEMKENYRPVSILPMLSKVFEIYMFAQMSNLFLITFFRTNNTVSKRICTQYYLLVMLEDRKRSSDRSRFYVLY